jgi:hypothetical protein
MKSMEAAPNPTRLPWWIALAGFGAIAITLNGQEHRAHFLGTLPYQELPSAP